MDIDLMLTITKNFTQELQRSEDGKKTSLPFIVQQIPRSSVVEDNERFQILVVGGSVGKSAVAKRKGKTITFTSVKEFPLPVFTDKRVFYQFIDEYVDPSVSVMAMNFAYPLTPVFDSGVLDGSLLSGTKEHAFEGLLGEVVGAGITNYLKRKHKRSVTVSLANDTICLLLSGLTRHTWSEVSAGVVGTGLNFAYFLDADKPVNLESAFFSRFPQSAEGKLIDKRSVESGASLFEKEVSGAYLYKHFNLVAQKEEMHVAPLETTEQLNALARKKMDPGSGLARLLLERSAALVACQIAGITTHKKQDMAFVMEGSLFWHGYGYKDAVERYLKLIVPQYTVSFHQIKDSELLGAAKLVA